MAAKSAIFDNDLLKLIFNGTPIATLADNAVSSPVANLYVSLHTDNPTSAGDQTSNEAAYTGYARVGVPRSVYGWTVDGSTVTPVANIVFPQAQGGGETETYFAVGTAASGPGKILYLGSITPGIAVSYNITPALANTTAITES